MARGCTGRRAAVPWGVSLLCVLRKACERAALALVVLLALGSSARAQSEKVALLPLDAPGKLAIYGQPVAAEVARVLGEAALVVVVVSADQAVPLDAALVIDGSISSTRRQVTVELRVRALHSSVPLLVVSATERSLATLDRAAKAVAAKLLPQLQAELAQRRPRPAEPTASSEPPVEAQAEPEAAPLPPALLAISAAGPVAADVEGFASGVLTASARLTRARWQGTRIALAEVSPAAVLGAVAAAPGSIGVGISVRSLEVTSGPAFVGRVRARVILASGGKVLFDRVVVTDSVVGKRKGDRAQLLDLLAREVVDIVRPRFFSALGPPRATTVGGARHASWR